MQTQVWSVRKSCLEMPFGKVDTRLKNMVCTEAQNIIKFKQIFNGIAKNNQTKKEALSPRYDTSLANSQSTNET